MRNLRLFIIFLLACLSFNGVNAFIPINGPDIIKDITNSYVIDYRDNSNGYLIYQITLK